MKTKHLLIGSIVGAWMTAAAQFTFTAYKLQPGTPGNQAYGGSLGMDFIVNKPVTVTELGVFDDNSDGLKLEITVELYGRNDGKTPDDVSDDAEGQKLASLVFTPNDSGYLEGGSRFKPLAKAVELKPGAYTISAFGYGSEERNGNKGIAGQLTWSTDPAGDAIRFIGKSHYGDPGAYPGNQDGGPGNRYAAGTFKYVAPDTTPVAYVVPAGTAGNQAFNGSLGMDFVAKKAITITDVGVFDDNSDGLKRAITAQIWTRNDGGTPTNFADDTAGEPLATVEFKPGEGSLAAGSRFKPLAKPLDLAAGSYCVVAWGYGDGERNGNNLKVWTTNDGGGLLEFVGNGHWGDPGKYPANQDGGPVNRYGAGTFRYTELQAKTAYIIDPATAGTQNYGGSLGMDFIVLDPITVTELGVYDADSDGLKAPITVELWTRDDGGTPNSFTDDGPGKSLLKMEFTEQNQGRLEGGSRFRALDKALVLAPGPYCIVAWGYNDEEKNGNGHGARPFGRVTDASQIRFVGGAHYGAPEEYPPNQDGGPANRYGAGTFKFRVEAADTDGDGWDDAFEKRTYGSLAESPKTDYDKDGVSNGDEIARKLNPLKADTDGDGLNDGAETGTGKFVSAGDAGTNPLKPDTDGDGLPDGAEVSAKTDPFKADTDGDGVTDGREVAGKTDPLNPNSKPAGAGTVAYVVPTGTVGNQSYPGSLGMDFIVTKAIDIKELGVFDHESDGLQLPITVALWSRDEAETPDDPSDDTGKQELVRMVFEPGDGVLEGGSRFKPLLNTLTLKPGAYCIVAWGYGGTERNGNLGIGDLGLTTEGTNGAIEFVGRAHYGPPDDYPPNQDGGPENRYAAGTFSYALSSGGGQQGGNVDTDKDGLTDTQEAAVGTDKTNPDTDFDGALDGAEVAAGTDPKSAASKLRVTRFLREGADLTVAWSSAAGKNYKVETTVDGKTWIALQSKIASGGAETTYKHVGGLKERQRWYRVALE